MDEEGLIQERLDVQRFPFADVVPDILPDVQNTDDIVDRPLVDGKTAVILFLDELKDLVLRHINVDRRDIDAAGQDALHRHVAELERRRDQVALLLVDLAVLRHVLNDVVDVILRDGRFLFVSLHHLRDCIADVCQKSRERLEDRHKEPQNAGCGKT